jgi:luciferase family oxidoreductase group 1
MPSNMTAYSVLDQAPTRAQDAPGEAIRALITLARHVDALGYKRFWVAEHHAMGGVASSAPEVLIGHLALATRHLRVGSGAILLPNHRPLHVAEQFRTLEALHPGRIDLGIGRSEGAIDEATVIAFRRLGDSEHGSGYDEQVDELLAFGGVRPLPPEHPLAGVRAVPADVPLPPVFMLGSTPSSAATAARKGLGYGFAAYTNPEAVADALRLYRREFVPARPGDRPYAILGLKVVVGEDDQQARALALPWHLALVQNRAGNPSPLMTVEAALRHRLTEPERQAEARVDRRADVVGDIEHARERIEALVAESRADEVIATTNTYESAQRRASYERLAAAGGLTAPPAASHRPTKDD